MSARGDGWVEVAPRVFQRRYEPVDVSVVAIVGDAGVTIVDTRNNAAEGDEILRDAASAFPVPVVAVVNTHAHYDHTFGNQAFVERGVPVYGHARIRAHFAAYEAPRLAAVQADPAREPDKHWAGVLLTPPTVLVDSERQVEFGGRRIDLIPIGAGHTDTDLAVLIPDARTWLLGDVIEQSGAPMFGSGSFPLTWSTSLEALVERIEQGDTVIPGHGAPVDRDFVVEQARLLAGVASMIRGAHAAGSGVGEVVPSAELAAFWPDWMLRSALREGLAAAAAAADAGRES